MSDHNAPLGTAPTARNERLRGALLILLAATLWGTLGIQAKYALSLGMKPIELAFFRAALGGVFFAGHALSTGANFPRGKDLGLTVLFGLGGITIFYGSYQLAIAAGGASLASVLLYTAPAFVALLAWRFLGDRLGVGELFAVAVTIAGVGLIARSGGENISVTTASLGFGLLSALMYAQYYLYGKTFFAKYRPVALYAIAMPVGAIGLLPFAVREFRTHSAFVWLLVLTMGAFSTYGANLTYSAGLRHLPATRASVIASLEPVIATVLAAIFFAEHLSAVSLVGAAMVIGSALALSVASARD